MTLWCLRFPQKNERKSFFRWNRTIFVRFFEEIEDIKNHFEINWPLETYLKLKIWLKICRFSDKYQYYSPIFSVVVFTSGDQSKLGLWKWIERGRFLTLISILRIKAGKGFFLDINWIKIFTDGFRAKQYKWQRMVFSCMSFKWIFFFGIEITFWTF